MTVRARTLAAYRAHVSEGMAGLAEMMSIHVEARSLGTKVWDEEGREYLDCGGYGVFILGHRHPAVVKAVRAQLDRHPMSSRVMLNAELATAAEALARVAPPGLESVFFTNSGAESVELAIKLARINGRTRLIAAEAGFHGKTTGALSLTGKPLYRDPFTPLLGEVEHVPFDDLAALESALAGRPPAAVFLEPVQAEGGVVIPADGYLSGVRELCDRHGALLVLDEVQTGLGRLGTMWGADHDGVAPDVLLCGKGLSGGIVPVAAVVATPEVYAPLSQDPFLHSSTYAGNPLAMAAARAAVQTIAGDGIVDRARSLGEELLREIAAIAAECAPTVVTDVRGRGLLLAIEFAEDHFALDLVVDLLARGVIVSTSLNAHRVVRLHPAAVMDGDDVARLLGALRASATAIEARHAPAGQTS